MAKMATNQKNPGNSLTYGYFLNIIKSSVFLHAIYSRKISKIENHC